jgi:hypothetical protein
MRDGLAVIRFPEGFVTTYWPGYFWHLEQERLYSIKSGVLKELKQRPAYYTRHFGRLVKVDEPNYQISVCGRRILVQISRLKRLKAPATDQILTYIPYQEGEL